MSGGSGGGGQFREGGRGRVPEGACERTLDGGLSGGSIPGSGNDKHEDPARNFSSVTPFSRPPSEPPSEHTELTVSAPAGNPGVVAQQIRGPRDLAPLIPPTTSLTQQTPELSLFAGSVRALHNRAY